MPKLIARSLFGLVVALLLVAAPGLVSLAQEATPAAAECHAPDLPPGTPTPFEDMDFSDMGMEEDVAATPVIPSGTPADEATVERVTAAVANVLACFSDGNFPAMAALFTPAGLIEEFGIANPHDLEFLLVGGAPITLVSVSDVQVHDDGIISADVETAYVGIQVERERWFLVEDGDFLLVESTPSLPVVAPDGAVTLDVNMVDFAFELSRDTLPSSTPLVFNVVNTGEYPHELLLVQMAQSADPEMLLTGELTFDDIGIYAGTYADAGETAPPMVLLGLNPGTYYLICLVDIPDGVPHLARGMVTEITIAD